MEYLTNGIGWNGVHEDITPIITKPDGSKEYRISDHLASLRVSLTNGSALKGYDYDPWGNLLGGATAPRRGFNDNEKDKENGLFSLGVRKYEEGRFLSLDPLFEKEPEISPYVYAGNAPLNYVDPEGKQRRGVASVPVSILYSPDGVNIGIGGAWGGAPGGSSSGFGIAGGALGTATGGWIASELLDDGGDAPPSSGGSGNAPSSGGSTPPPGSGGLGAGLGAAGAAAIKKSVENLTTKIASIVKQDSKLAKFAEQTFAGNKTLSKEANGLIGQLSKGNMNPGIGTKSIGKNIFEARSKGGARVYFRNGQDGVEILGYSNKANQQQVINRLLEVY